ncbi:helix-hairpin-helix domain-containing protein [Desulfovibrio ferrophilus]|nr:helix-hairpin-helix domain-containing protein [Desulfovibrio ferrophilus]
MSKTESIRNLKRIPGVGPSLSEDLYRLGFTSVSALADQDPQAMYDRLMELEGCHVDRCVLYVFRCAVYFASETQHDPARLKWWNWKDQS